jgi:hypothetical protein
MNMVADRALLKMPATMPRWARELARIHEATCRARRQGLACSTCSELVDRAARLEARP